MSSPQFETTVQEVERLVVRSQRQELDAGSFTRDLVDVFLTYLDQEDPRDDVTLLVEYCVGWAGELGRLGLFEDRTLRAEVEQQLGWCLERELHRFRFDQLLAELSRGLSDRDDDVRTRLVDLCAAGVGSHPRFFSTSGWGLEVLRLADAHRQPRALHAALRPTNPGRLATPRRDQGAAYWMALAFLGHQATDPVHDDSAAIARGALVDLAGFEQVGRDAVVRLPPHLLDEDDRHGLLEVLERRERDLRTWEREGFDCVTSRRDVELLRTVLWQAADCARAGISM